MIFIKHTKYILPALIIAFNIMLILFPSEAVNAAKEGLILWYSAALPALFPFAAGTSLLIRLNIISRLSRLLSPVSKKLFGISPQGLFAFISGVTSGYPIGIATLAELYETKQISREEALHLSFFCSNSGPLFILGTVGAAMLKSSQAGIILLISHYLAPLTAAICLKPCAPAPTRNVKAGTASSVPFGKALSLSIETTCFSMLNVGGFIVFFSVVTELIRLSGILKVVSEPLSLFGISGKLTENLLLSLTEMTNGCRLISLCDMPFKLPLLSLIISFGGLCVHAQSTSLLSAANLPAGKYIKGKVLCAVLSFGYCLLINAAAGFYLYSK